MQVDLDVHELSAVVVARKLRNAWVISSRSGDNEIRLTHELSRIPEAITDGVALTQGDAVDAALLQYLRFYFLREGRLAKHIRYDQMFMGSRTPHRPDHVSLILTKLCNFACLHCYNDSGLRHPNELTATEKLDLVDYLGRWGVPNLILSGGEPTLDPALQGILNLAGRHRMAVKITTNVWKIPIALLDAIGANIVQQVNVSLDSSTPDHHDLFRVKPGSYKRVIDGIAQFKQAGVRKLVVNSSISSGRIGDMEALARLSLEHGADQISFKAVLQSGRKQLDSESNVLSDSEKAQFQKERERLKHKFGRDLVVEGGLITEDVPNELLDDVSCNAATTAMMIDADGSMMPCEIVKPYVTPPNFRTIPPAWVWASDDLFSRFRQVKVDYAGGCGTKGCPGCAMSASQNTFAEF